MTISKQSLMPSQVSIVADQTPKAEAGRHEEFGTPSWAVPLLVAVLAMAVGGSLAHPGVTARKHPLLAHGITPQRAKNCGHQELMAAPAEHHAPARKNCTAASGLQRQYGLALHNAPDRPQGPALPPRAAALRPPYAKIHQHETAVVNKAGHLCDNAIIWCVVYDRAGQDSASAR